MLAEPGSTEVEVGTLKLLMARSFTRTLVRKHRSPRRGDFYVVAQMQLSGRLLCPLGIKQNAKKLPGAAGLIWLNSLFVMGAPACSVFSLEVQGSAIVKQQELQIIVAKR